MKLQRIIAGAVGAALVGATLASCTASSEPSEGEDVTLTFWTHTHPPMIEVFEELIAEYEDENPNVTIDYQTIPNADFNTKMLTSLSNGSGPDIINMDDAALRGDYIPKGLLAPIDAEALGAADADEVIARYIDGTLAGATGEDGELYGLPSEYNGSAFAINTQHFADAGLDPATTSLETWQDVSEVGKKLAAAGHTQAFGFLYLHALWYAQQYQTLLHQVGGEIADGDEGRLDSDDAIEALQIWTDLSVGPDAVSDPNVSSREATTPFQDLATGTQSMAIVYPWAMQQISETNPDVYEQLQVVPLPQADPSEPTSRVYAYYYAVNEASKQKAEAWRFIQFLSEHPAEFLEGTDFVQPVVGWESSAAAQEIPFIDVWADAYSIGRFDQVTPYYAEVQDAIQKMVNDVVFDGVSVEDSAKDASDAVTRILQG
ncbi:sugar ABC transporter substrate-binding protein [Microbacterium lushaniae]|nr:sugar ABC transporter substrate-binding protein [Microbacterium lushaniae]KAA9157396.1 sugar ABC transporter substrate-binding protein [Microbacterium lushaniae]